VRDLLDARTTERITLHETAEMLHARPTHLVRVFTHAHGLPSHQYLTGRRIELTRRCYSPASARPRSPRRRGSMTSPT
jgi:AraC-like DNA-binding protein